ncbi:hypothetical protein LTS08_001722 [Lithohypha guttulata]|uniref:beta-glucosidase n=1 Tax=Lithohypha guttulata TaxID=1690604 RepID=A0AAN7Y4H7_9EURO|nr:hypothetical protein LTR05_007242 [Lithohypha guttulata]KAK5105445.1 hypothetical protein LTS08_001722 [Lithohypha guttulata]
MVTNKVLKFGTAALLATTTTAQGQITNDTYFYGQSEPVYPSPNITGLGNWAAAFSQAQAFVAQLTIEEKTNLTGGYAGNNGCSGNIYAIPRLGFPGLCVTDAGQGVRATDFVNGYASGIHVGASWNKQLTYQRGVDMGGEFRAKGVNIQLGPVVGPLGRVAEGGRNWEGFSNDPYLSGKLVAQHITGFQTNGVGTCTKHYIGNEQETERNPTLSSSNQTIESISTNIDDTTLHELYLWPFVDAAHAGTVSMMCSYQRVNNSYGCQNSKILNGVLKTELGFQGFVMSDWFAQHSGVASAQAGMDMVMPSGLAFWGPNLTQAVENGTVSESRLDDMATRIMASWYYTNQQSGFPQPGYGMPANLLAPHDPVNARNPAARAGLLQAAIEGHVLVKNTNNALPLRNPQLLTVHGYDAVWPLNNMPAPGLSGWALGLTSTDPQSVLCGFSAVFGPCTPFLGYAANGTLYTGGGSGATSPAYISAPLDAIQSRVIQTGNTVVYWDTINNNATSAVAGAADACLVFINAEASEGVDRPNLRDTFSDTLVRNIANQCSNTIVTIHNAGIRLVDSWIDHPNVTAVIYAHLPGQDSGTALVDILFGDVSPSGKLPYTVARNESDYGAILAAVPPGANGSQYQLFPQDTFSEGVYIDYRAFDAQNITPRYEFGFGLTYSNFSYSNIVVNPGPTGNLSPYPTGPIVPGGHADLFDNLVSVTATITNTGSVAAAEVGQLYLSIPAAGQPVRQLRGFEKVFLQPGQSATVTFDLQRRDLSVWDVVAQQWRLVQGSAYTVSVGASSRNLPLTSTFTL